MEKKLQLGPENLLLKKTIKRSHFFNKHIHLQNGIYFMMNFPVAILVGRSVYNSLVFSMYSPSIDAWLTYATCLWHQGVCFACLPSGRVTWQWNIPHNLNMYFLLKKGDVPASHVSFQRCFPPVPPSSLQKFPPPLGLLMFSAKLHPKPSPSHRPRMGRERRFFEEGTTNKKCQTKLDIVSLMFFSSLPG